MRFVGATKEVRRRNGFEGVRFLGTKTDVDLLMNMYDFEKEAIRRAADGDFQGCFEGAYPKKLEGVVNNPRPVATAHLGLREAFKPSVEKGMSDTLIGQFLHSESWPKFDTLMNSMSFCRYLDNKKDAIAGKHTEERYDPYGNRMLRYMLWRPLEASHWMFDGHMVLPTKSFKSYADCVAHMAQHGFTEY